LPTAKPSGINIDDFDLKKHHAGLDFQVNNIEQGSTTNFALRFVPTMQ
jgi:hypothetical protein